MIVGGGVIGLLTAYRLRRRGAAVTVVDKGDLGGGASAGNAGWVSPSLSAPVPAPGLTWTSLKWMLRADSPLYIHPGAVPSMLGWLWSFWRHCNARAYQAGLEAVARLNRDTLTLFRQLQEDGLDFELHTTGLLLACERQATIDQLMADLEQMQGLGLGTPQRLSPADVRDLEPALRPGLAGGVLAPDNWHVRPESLTAAVVQRLRDLGAVLLPRTRVTGLALHRGRVTGVYAGDQLLEADHVLIATGAEAAWLAQQAGFHLPMQAGKGYSLTVQAPKVRVNRAVYLEEARIAISPFASALRVAGTMELSGINTRVDRRRVDAIRRGADRYLPGWDRGEGITIWTGMRPMLPDGLPAIGRAPGFDNLYVAAGHAMLGVTLGPATATAVADLILTGRSDYDLAPFDPARFDRYTRHVR